MAEPDWIGSAPERPYFSDDGRSVYFRQKRKGEDRRDLMRMDLSGNRLRTISDEEMGLTDVAGGAYNHDRTRKVYANHGDIFVKDLLNGSIVQLTRTVQSESGPRFMVDGERIMYRRGTATLVRELSTGLEYQPADLRAEKDPDKKKKSKKFDYLKEQQKRFYVHLRENKEKSDKAKARRKEAQRADATQTPLPWYLGDDVTIRRQVLAPTEDWMVLRLAPKKVERGKRDGMPQYVDESGYVTTRQVRSKVGTGKPAAEQLVLLELRTHKKHKIDLSVLPGIKDDPLKELREAAEAARKEAKKKQEKEEAGDDDEESKDEDAAESDDDGKGADDEKDEDADKPKKDKKPKARPVSIGSVTWSKDGKRVALQCFSADHKDRWIATIDLAEKKLVPLERMTDEAWINRRMAALGWLEDNETLYFISEEDGYAHLYTRSLADDSRRQLTKGAYEVSGVRQSRDGYFLYYTANVDHPGIYEAYRVNVATGKIDQLTNLGGRNRFQLSPDEEHLLITHSTTTRPNELFVQPNEAGAAATQVTRTVSEAFTKEPWVEPEIVAIPSRAGRPIYSRVYTPDGNGTAGKRPAVVFVHGAGYLQNSHAGWSGYFREFMFHTLLTQRGYVVLDMDYRASAGYGRDWRTAIYRNMGTPELEDLQDGVAWLTANKNVDPKRVGVYGGSYGGFMTLMALFRDPDLFACGASLRPVTDWAHYNHGYTSNILNTPEVDPEAYERSSPIEFAEGLNKPLLICHGMQDDNVFFQDTIRLAQHLIELKKEDWEVAVFPVEPHGFRRPDSWLNEYRRILKLFETHLK